jgi:uncharacterized protein (DUF302 family)
MILRLIVLALSLFLTPIFAADKIPAIEISMTVVKVPIIQKSMDEAADYLKKRTQELGIEEITHNLLHKAYQTQGLANIRRTEIFQFCDAKVAHALIEYDLNFAALIPCRVGLVEDEQGKAWFVMMNPNIFRAALTSLPPDIRKSAQICNHLMKIIGAAPVAFSTNIPSLALAQAVVKRPLAEDVSRDEAIDSLKLRANDLNLKLVRHHVLTDKYKTPEVSNIKHIEIFQFCDAEVSQKMLQHDISYLAYMPCRLAFVENKQGKGWFVMTNMDFFITLGNLPPKLSTSAMGMHHKLMEMITAGANGDL